MKPIKRLFFWCCWPALFLYFYGSRRNRVLLLKDEKALLVKGWWKRWFADERWGLPGGGLRRGENPLASAVRELHEELGLSLTAADFELLGEAYITEYGLRYRAIFLVCDVRTNLALRVPNREIKQAEWLDLTSATNLKPEIKQALELLARR